MKRATFVIPKQDNDGNRFPRAVVLEIQKEILEQWQGFTVREVRGGWVDEDGKTYIDSSWEYTIVLEDEKVESLIAWLKTVREKLKQQAMWLETVEAQGQEIR